MQNDYLNNKKKINQKKETKNTVQINSLSKKKTVDINKLLNRVKIKENQKQKDNLLLLAIASTVIGIAAFIIFF
jgi:ABC-type taurine transport system substrate-binding protein